MFVFSDAVGNGPMQWVYMNMLSTGPVWLFMAVAIVASLVPDLLIGVWETYGAGDGVLVNQVRRWKVVVPGRIVSKRIDNATPRMTRL